MFIPALIALALLLPSEPPEATLAGTTLQNVITLADGAVINGSAPLGEADFAALAARGVKTIIAVDGALPPVEQAARHGLRYVHLPVSYDGIPSDKLEDCARAVHQLPGPVYIHCLHGKHRSPAMTAATLVALGELEPDEGVRLLETAGTSPRYPGLYEAVRKTAPLPAATLDRPTAFPAQARPSTLVGQMVEIDRIFARLETLRAGDWQKSAAAPDLDAGHLAKQLRQQLQAVRPAPQQSSEKVEEFRAELAASLAATDALTKAIDSEDTAAMTRGFDAVNTSCRSCHADFRDAVRLKNGN